MTENKLELDIISLYDENVKSLYSINQISKKLNKTYPYINKKVNYLIQKDILKMISFGRSHLCELNLANDKTIVLLALHEINKKEQFLDANETVRTLLKAIKQHTHISCALAVKNGTSRKLVVVCETQEQKNSITQYEVHALTRKEFLIEITKDRNSFIEDRIVLSGFERYFECLSEVDEDITKLYSPLAV